MRVRQVKSAINELATQGPSPAFQQNLDCFLQKERFGLSALRRRAVWGIALVAALTAFFGSNRQVKWWRSFLT